VSDEPVVRAAVAPRVPTGDERLMTPAFLGISISVLAFFIAGGMFLPATPRFTAGPLGGNDLAVGLVVGSFSVSSLLLRPFAGRWADQRGRRIMLIVGAALQVVAAAGHLIADTVPLLIAMRLLLGAAEALFFVGGMAAATDLAPERRRGEAVSLISTSLYLGVAIGPVLAEWLYNASGYAAIWIVATGISIAAVAISWFAPETLPPSARRKAGDGGSLLHRRGIVPGLLVLCGAWGMGAYFAFLPLLGDDLGLDGVGGYLAAFALVVIGLRLVGARLPDRFGAARLSGTALVLSASGMAIAGLFPTEIGLWVATIVFAGGVAFTFPAIVALSVMGVPPAERGAVVGTTSLFLDVAFGLSPALLGLLAVSTGYPPTFLVSGVVAAIGATYLLLRGGRLAPTGTETPAAARG
jgi:MFS family permease